VTRNPHVDPASGAGPRTPGGSSSGSGAAVGDAHVPIALATQTGGSTVRPAAFNGVYGLKPTWGAVSREGQKFYSLLLDTLGWYARSAADLRLLADVLGVDDDDDESAQGPPFAGLRGARIAVCRTVVWPRAAPATRAALARAADILRAHGAVVEDLELPAAFDRIPEWHRVLLQTDGRATFLAEHRTARPALHKSLAIYIDKPEFTRRQGLEAQDGIAALRPRFDELAGLYDAVLTPSVIDEAPLGLEFTGSADFCNTWSVSLTVMVIREASALRQLTCCIKALHVPVVNIPGFKGPNGLPIGVSLVAPRFRDRHLLEVAEEVGKIFEAEGGWTRRLL
jgi:amidase